MRSPLGKILCIAVLAAGVVGTTFPLTALAGEQKQEPCRLTGTIQFPNHTVTTEKDRWSAAVLPEVLERFLCDYVRILSVEELVGAMLDGGLSNLDPHSSIMSREEFRNFMESLGTPFGGVGMTIGRNEDDVPGILVHTVVANGPSARAGIQEGDVITHIDGTPTADLSFEKAANLLGGPIGSSVTVTVVRSGAERPFPVTIVRDEIVIPTVRDAKLVPIGHGNVGYIRVTDFGERTVVDLQEAYRKLEKENSGKLAGLVLDLRDNTGGLLTSVDGVNDLFLNGTLFCKSAEPDNISECPTVISEESRGVTRTETVIGPSPDIAEGIPMVIIENGRSASASEVFASSLCDAFKRAVCAGVRSFGKGSVQTIFELNNGGVLLLTTAQYLIGPKGCERAVQGVGVMPSIRLSGATFGDIKREADLQNALLPSTVSNENCRFRPVLPDGHMEMAHVMLRALGLLPTEADDTPAE